MVEKTTAKQFAQTNYWRAREKKQGILEKIEIQKINIKRFQIMEDYSMDSSEESIQEDFGDIIEEEEPE